MKPPVLNPYHQGAADLKERIRDRICEQAGYTPRAVVHEWLFPVSQVVWSNVGVGLLVEMQTEKERAIWVSHERSIH